MSFAAIRRAITADTTGLAVDVPETWKQGRTAYGGLSTALSLIAAQAQAADRPLRSALISFVGPSDGRLSVVAERLRAGRTASSVRTRLTGESGVGVECVFTFAEPRESALSVQAAPLPDHVAPPAAGVAGLGFPPGAPQFTQHFELLDAAGTPPFSGAAGDGPLRFWTRHRDAESRTGIEALICLADALPPAITTAMTRFAPLSSMTWMIDLLSDDLSTRDGWYLLESSADHADHGYSSQAMAIWSTDGRCLAQGRQMVTVFA